MKIENTLENRTKFFSLYYGQKVLYIGGLGLVVMWLGGWNLRHPDFFLQLKPLESISDNDAKYLGFSDNISATTTYLKSLGKELKEADYLRSKGYALPWMDLSVDDLVEYGWIKLSNELK
jgi:hypothetical protein